MFVFQLVQRNAGNERARQAELERQIQDAKSTRQQILAAAGELGKSYSLEKNTDRALAGAMAIMHGLVNEQGGSMKLFFTKEGKIGAPSTREMISTLMSSAYQATENSPAARAQLLNYFDLVQKNVSIATGQITPEIEMGWRAQIESTAQQLAARQMEQLASRPNANPELMSSALKAMAGGNSLVQGDGEQYAQTIGNLASIIRTSQSPEAVAAAAIAGVQMSIVSEEPLGDLRAAMQDVLDGNANPAAGASAQAQRALRWALNEGPAKLMDYQALKAMRDANGEVQMADASHPVAGLDLTKFDDLLSGFIHSTGQYHALAQLPAAMQPAENLQSLPDYSPQADAAGRYLDALLNYLRDPQNSRSVKTLRNGLTMEKEADEYTTAFATLDAVKQKLLKNSDPASQALGMKIEKEEAELTGRSISQDVLAQYNGKPIGRTTIDAGAAQKFQLPLLRPIENTGSEIANPIQPVESQEFEGTSTLDPGVIAPKSAQIFKGVSDQVFNTGFYTPAQRQAMGQDLLDIMGSLLEFPGGMFFKDPAEFRRLALAGDLKGAMEQLTDQNPYQKVFTGDGKQNATFVVVTPYRTFSATVANVNALEQLNQMLSARAVDESGADIGSAYPFVGIMTHADLQILQNRKTEFQARGVTSVNPKTNLPELKINPDIVKTSMPISADVGGQVFMVLPWRDGVQSLKPYIDLGTTAMDVGARFGGAGGLEQVRVGLSSVTSAYGQRGKEYTEGGFLFTFSPYTQPQFDVNVGAYLPTWMAFKAAKLELNIRTGVKSETDLGLVLVPKSLVKNLDVEMGAAVHTGRLLKGQSAEIANMRFGASYDLEQILGPKTAALVAGATYQRDEAIQGMGLSGWSGNFGVQIFLDSIPTLWKTEKQ